MDIHCGLEGSQTSKCSIQFFKNQTNVVLGLTLLKKINKLNGLPILPVINSCLEYKDLFYRRLPLLSAII